MAQKRIVVLGAGSTGLGVGLGIALSGDGSQTTVVERNFKVGGLAGSFDWNGHTVDYGPHRLSPNIETVRVIAEEMLGPDCLVQKSQHGVQLGSKLYQFPPRVRDWIGPVSMFMGFRLVLSYVGQKFLWIVRRFDTDDFESIMKRTFGKYFYQRIAGPMTGKVWIDPSKIDPSFATLRFSHVSPREIIKKVLFPRQELNPSSFYYPRRGFQQLWDQIERSLKGHRVDVRCSAKPVAIEVRGQRIVSVAIEENGKTEKIEGEDLHVVSTIPLVNLLRVLEGFPEQKEVENAVSQVKFRSMLLICFEFETPRALPFRTLIFPEKNFVFNRLFEQNEYSRDTVKAGKSVVVADITVPRNSDEMGWSDDKIIEWAKADLKKLKYVPMGKLSAAHVERVEFAYMVPDIESRKAIFEAAHTLSRITNLDLLGRFSVGEYDNSDYAIDNGVALGGVLTGRIPRIDYLRNLHQKRGRSIVG